jgi:hypothetical protein
MEIGGATSPVTNDKQGRFFENEFIYRFSECQTINPMKGRANSK